MSILNDAGHSSRLKSSISTTPVNTLAGNLLSRKRKRDGHTPPPAAPSRSTKPPPRAANPLQKSFSESFLPPPAHLSLPPRNPRPSLPQTFVVRSVDNDKALSFRILSTLPRPALPLSYLDSSPSPPRLFSAHLPHLDHDAQSTPPLVLIARLEAQPTPVLYAVERVGHERYSLCKLAAWLEPHHLDGLTLPVHVVPPSLKDPSARQSHDSWWLAVRLDTRSSQLPPSRKIPRLSLCRPDPQPLAPSPVPEPDLTTLSVDQPSVAEEACDTVDDLLSRFISQYLDTLYLSKTPLAFFTKGPLSRLRAAFTAGQIDGATLSDLVIFLRNLIHSSSTADKKYRDKLPELLKDLPSQQNQHHTPAAKKKRRKRKLKPDKSGLLPEEAEFFARWWYQDETCAPSDETAEQSLKRRAPQLRTRETFMQVVLLLEILSLETLPDFKSLQEKEPQTKSNKGDSTMLSLELLVDKLCIWHSLHTADLLGDGPKLNETAKDGANQLHSFCVEVIIPFYMSRTHEHASFVNKKLGGPGTSTTSRPKHSRKPSDAEVKPAIDKKPRRSLARVATESFPQPAKTPRSFSRSATDSQVVSIKRETPDISLSLIPPRRDSQPVLARKNEVLEKHRLRQREVDFGAIAAANEAKAKKRQEVEQKLKDAISTLKRPSRATVSGEFVDALEQRKRMAEGRARPPLTKRTSSTAQVAATPKNGHKTCAVAATPHHIPAPAFVRPSVPSSGPSLIPSSNIKQKSLSFAHFSPVNEASDDEDAIPATDNRPRHKNALADTPSKLRVGFVSLPGASPDEENDHVPFVGQERGDSSPLRESPTLLKTPSKPQRPRFSITPSKSTPPLNFAKGKSKEIVATTPQKMAASTRSEYPPGISSGSTERRRVEDNASKDQPDDIYAALGWDDDLDDD